MMCEAYMIQLFNTSIVHAINKTWFSRLQTLNTTGCWPKLFLQQIIRNVKSEEIYYIKIVEIEQINTGLVSKNIQIYNES